jgi:hypothetical protein
MSVIIGDVGWRRCETSALHTAIDERKWQGRFRL